MNVGKLAHAIRSETRSAVDETAVIPAVTVETRDPSVRDTDQLSPRKIGEPPAAPLHVPLPPAEKRSVIDARAAPAPDLAAEPEEPSILPANLDAESAAALLTTIKRKHARLRGADLTKIVHALGEGLAEGELLRRDFVHFLRDASVKIKPNVAITAQGKRWRIQLSQFATKLDRLLEFDERRETEKFRQDVADVPIPLHQSFLLDVKRVGDTPIYIRFGGETSEYAPDSGEPDFHAHVLFSTLENKLRQHDAGRHLTTQDQHAVLARAIMWASQAFDAGMYHVVKATYERPERNLLLQGFKKEELVHKLTFEFTDDKFYVRKEKPYELNDFTRDDDGDFHSMIHAERIWMVDLNNPQLNSVERYHFEQRKPRRGR